MAFLTIDDAPSDLFGEKLSFLTARALPAIFFCVGRDTKGREDDLARALGLGFELGNHSWTHPRFSSLGLTECLEEIERAHEAVDALYRRAGRPWEHRRFRFPFLDFGGIEAGGAIQERLREFGYEAPLSQDPLASIGGAIDGAPRDRVDTLCGFEQMEYWLGKPGAPDGLDRAEAILARIGPGRPGRGDVVLIHDHVGTHGLFFECVEGYLSHGIEFEPLR